MPSLWTSSDRYAFTIILALSCGLLLTGCDQLNMTGLSSAPSASINQDRLCPVQDFNVEANKAICTPGERIAFFPQTFGNAQLPVTFAALNCDMTQTIAMTNGGVACIFRPVNAIQGDEIDGQDAVSD